MLEKLNKKSFSILSIAIIIISAVWVAGIVIYQTKLLKEQPGTTAIIKDGTAYWRIYKNTDYGFEIKYPKNWECIEAQKIEDPEKIMKGIVGFGPQGKDYYEKYIVKPVNIAIYRGFAQGLIPEIPFIEENEIGEVVYGFKNPTKENLDVVITDETGFIVKDAAERDELKVIINKMISTFKFFE